MLVSLFKVHNNSFFVKLGCYTFMMTTWKGDGIGIFFADGGVGGTGVVAVVIFCGHYKCMNSCLN